MRDEISCMEAKGGYAMAQYKSAKVVSNEKLVDGIYRMVVETEIKEDIRPGHLC